MTGTSLGKTENYYPAEEAFVEIENSRAGADFVSGSIPWVSPVVVVVVLLDSSKNSRRGV